MYVWKVGKFYYKLHEIGTQFNMNSRVEVFAVRKIQAVIWFMTLFSVMTGHQRFGETCCLHLKGEDVGKAALRNVGILPHL
jgi:hypothetical protein